jgi:hypothetical protein
MTIRVVPGLVYGIDNGVQAASQDGKSFSYFYVMVEADGRITIVPDSISARADGNRLTLCNVLVLVDPTAYGGAYRVIRSSATSAPRSDC